MSTLATLTLAGGPVGSGGGGGAAGAGEAGCCCAAAAGLPGMNAPGPPRPADENAGGLVGATLGMNAVGAAFCTCRWLHFQLSANGRLFAGLMMCPIPMVHHLQSASIRSTAGSQCSNIRRTGSSGASR